jgi:hypothetical protein
MGRGPSPRPRPAPTTPPARKRPAPLRAGRRPIRNRLRHWLLSRKLAHLLPAARQHLPRRLGLAIDLLWHRRCHPPVTNASCLCSRADISSLLLPPKGALPDGARSNRRSASYSLHDAGSCGLAGEGSRMRNSRKSHASLTKLRRDFKRFDESGYLARHPYGMEGRQMLLGRIAELEAAMQHLTDLAKSVFDMDT